MTKARKPAKTKRDGKDPSSVTEVGTEPWEDAIDTVEQAWRRECPEVDVSSIGIISRIWRLSRHLDKERKTRLAQLGTDRVTVDVLAMLRRSGPPYRLSAGELTHHSLITSGGVSQRLRKLESAGMIRRHIDETDRRRIDVELTAHGMKLIDSVVADLMDHESKLLDTLAESDRDELRRTLKILLARFEPPDATQQEAQVPPQPRRAASR